MSSPTMSVSCSYRRNNKARPKKHTLHFKMRNADTHINRHEKSDITTLICLDITRLKRIGVKLLKHNTKPKLLYRYIGIYIYIYK